MHFFQGWSHFSATSNSGLRCLWRVGIHRVLASKTINRLCWLGSDFGIMSIRIIEDYFGEKKNLSTHRGIFPCSLKHIICTHISSFLNLPPLQVITEHWAEFPVLYNNFLLAICVLHTVVCICQYICHVYMSVCIHQCMCRVYTSVYMLCVYVSVYVVCICQWYSLWSRHTPLPTRCPQVLFLCPSLTSCPANRFLCTMFSRFCIHALIWSSSPTTGHIPWENHNSKWHMHPRTHCCTVYNNQDTEATWLSINDEGIRKIWCIYVAVVLVTKSHPALLRPHRLLPTRLLRPWDAPGKNTGVCCHSLLQRILPAQG